MGELRVFLVEAEPIYIKMSLTTLPILPLEVIASYLDFSSLVSLSSSTSSLAHLQPKQQIVKGENFSLAGIGWRSGKRKHDPEHYFDVEVKTRGLLGIKMVWDWEGRWISSGWWGTRSGYQHFTKAQFWLRLMRGDKVLAEYQYSGQAPERGREMTASYRRGYRSTWQDNHKQEFSVEQHSLTTGARRGDLIRVMIFVEGRYGLQVRDCQMTLLHKSPLPTDQPLPTEEHLSTDETSPAESSLPLEEHKKFETE